jgi:HD-like signal output (HDOD) protein
MSGTLQSFVGGWWARLFGRAPQEPARLSQPVRTLEAAPAPEPVAARIVEAPPVRTAAPAAGSDVQGETNIEESFREMVGLAAGVDFTTTPSAAESRVRDATLDALGQLKQIPALASLVQGVAHTMGKEGVSVDEVVEALEKDSALCIRLLAMANSVAISPEQRIVDLNTAVQMLGIARVQRVAQAVFTLHGAQRMVDGIDWRHLWIHALATAAIAEELERLIVPEPSAQIYMAGLLHYLGKIVLSTIAADAYRDVIVASWNGQGRLDVLERARFGVDHREAGVVFARGNKLSELVVEVIAHHGDPASAQNHRTEVAIVSIANFMSKARGLGFSGARLDAADGDIEQLPAWKVIASETGRAIDIGGLELEMAGFFASLRADLKGLRASAP